MTLVRPLKLARNALIRLPASDGIRNAVGYYLALLERYSEAETISEGAVDPNLPTVLATRGLIKLGEGQIKQGLDLYDKAIDVALEKSGDGQAIEEFRTIARLYEWLGLSRLGLSDRVEIQDHLPSLFRTIGARTPSSSRSMNRPHT